MDPNPRRASRLSARVFQALLTLYPAAFRDEYGREMTLVFTDRYRDTAGGFERTRLWVEVLTGVLMAAPREHIRLVVQDLRHASRRLRMSPGFAMTAVVTLAIAVGSNTAMFSVLNGVLLRPLPFQSPERLAMLWTENPNEGVRQGRSAYGSVEEWRRQSSSFADLAVFDPVSVKLTLGEESEQITVARASPNFFALLGVTPVRGRVFSGQESDDRQRLVVISYRFWRTRLSGSPQALGSSLELDGFRSLIIGILPEDFPQSAFAFDVWEPHTLFPDWDTRRAVFGSGSWFVVGRLKPESSFQKAQQEMGAMAGRLDTQRSTVQQNHNVSVAPLSLYVTGQGQRLAIWILIGATSLLLLVAAANVAGLSLARSSERVPEMAIRAALGGSRSGIVRMLVAESVMVAAIAGVLGLLLAAAAINVIRAFGPADLARLQEVTLDRRVFGWAVAISLLTGVLVGLATAMTIWRKDLRAAGAEGGRGIVGGSATRLRRVLVVAECAVAVMLLAGGGLLVRSWWNLMRVDPGFRSKGVLSMNVAMPVSIEGDMQASFWDRLLERVASVPGVDEAGISSELFIGNVAEQLITVEGPDGPITHRLRLRSDEVSPGLFDTLSTPLLRGRVFSAQDGPGAPRVIVINQAMADRVWPHGDPVGRRVALGVPRTEASWLTVVGVVGNMRRQSLDTEPIPQLFESLGQNPSRRAILFARTTTADPFKLTSALRAAVRQTDGQALTYNVTTVDARLGASVAMRRIQTSLLAGLSLVSLLLATIGLYGLIQYSVAARTREIGIRMALGARVGDIFGMVVREGLILGLAGLVLGLVAAWWFGGIASSVLFEVTATDPLTFIVVPLLVTAVTVVASCLPARRAMNVAPVVALQR